MQRQWQVGLTEYGEVVGIDGPWQDWVHAWHPGRARLARFRSRFLVRCHQRAHQRRKPGTRLPSLLSERWERRAHPGTQADIRTWFVQGPTEAPGGVARTQAAHRRGALLDATVILLEAMVEIGTAAVYAIVADRLTAGTGRALMGVRGHVIWG